jgi:hypothetical protein
MSDFQPSLDDYPGYFPAAKPPFWTRAKVGTAAAVAGLLLGAGAAGSSGDAADTSGTFTQADLDRTVAAATADLQGQLAQARQPAAQDTGDAQRIAALQDQLKKQQAAAKARIATVKQRAAAAQRKAVAEAVADAKAEAAAASTSSHQFASSGGGGTDPRFNYCYEAIDAGYGPYHEGQDPEYDWYDDADGDGVVCE